MNTENVAKILGISKSTLLRWITCGLIYDVNRDHRGWRIWSNEDIQRVIRFKETYWGIERPPDENNAHRWRHNHALSLSLFRSNKYTRLQNKKENEDNKE